jgi:hypothetical protein
MADTFAAFLIIRKNECRLPSNPPGSAKRIEAVNLHNQRMKESRQAMSGQSAVTMLDENSARIEEIVAVIRGIVTRPTCFPDVH